MKTNRITAIIPARYASTRLPIKPLIDLCGKPMIQHVYERVRKASLVDRIIVATDHEKIAEVVKGFGCEVAMTPGDLQSGSDRIAYVAKSITGNDIIVNVQGDEPLIAPQVIDEGISTLLYDPAVQVGTFVKMIRSAKELVNPNIVKAVLDNDGFAVYFSRTPIPYWVGEPDVKNWHRHHHYYKHIGLYIFRKKFLLQFTTWPQSSLERAEKLEQLRIIENGHRIKVKITDYDSIPVDTMENVINIRKILKQEMKVK